MSVTAWTYVVSPLAKVQRFLFIYIIGTFNFNFVLPIWWLSNGLDVHFSHQLKHHFICVAGSNVSFCVNCLKAIFKVTLRAIYIFIYSYKFQ